MSPQSRRATTRRRAKRQSLRTVQPQPDVIVQRRLARGWSQERLVESIADSCEGDPSADRITIGTLQNIEAGRPCFVRSMAAIAGALRCSVEDLVVKPHSGTTNGRASTPVRIALLASGNLSYTRDISIGFRARIEQGLGTLASESEFVQLSGTTNADDNWEDWCRLLDRRGGDVGFNYYVTVGTQAAGALRDHLGAQFGAVPFIFLGVTDPVRSGLVASLTHRQEDLQVAGVGYGPGMGQLALRIRKAFPGRQLVYVFCNRFPQDRLAADMLRDLSMYRDGSLRIVETVDMPTASDLHDETAVYFSWYTFELLYERAEGVDLLKQRLVVATTRGNVQGPGLAALGVGADDREIGDLGAEIVLRHMNTKSLHLGSLDVVIPPLQCWINNKTVRQIGVQLDSGIRAGAEVFS
jgi:hypothetical protein